VTANEFYAADPRRECRERPVGTRWTVDGTARSADVRWFAESRELVIVDGGEYHVWAAGCDQASLEALLADDVVAAARPLSWLRRALDGVVEPRLRAAARLASG
jgi:hypothetical protein